MSCHICRDIDESAHAYAHTKAHHDVNNIASMKAFTLSNSICSKEQTDYYMMFYRIEYIKLYSDSYEHYREEFIRISVEKFQNATDICGYHCENIRWHKYPETRYY